LQIDGELADLVEEERAPRSFLERPDAPHGRPRERALFVPEELTFEQVAVDRPAIDDHERGLAAGALAVDGVRRLALAGAGFAFEQHRRVAVSGAREHREGRPHRGRNAGERAEARLLGERQPVRLQAELEAYHRLSQPKKAPDPQECFQDNDAVEDRTVAALQVADAHAALVDDDLAMEARDGRILDDEVVAVVGSDRATVAC